MIEVRRLLAKALQTTRRVLSIDDMGLDADADELSLPQLAAAIIRSATEKRRANHIPISEEKESEQDLPKVITFPFARHSSYEELCCFVKAFKPKDVYPCTEDKRGWYEGMSNYRIDGSC